VYYRTRTTWAGGLLRVTTTEWDLSDASEALAAGSVSAGELVDQCLAEIERRQSSLNCFVAVDEIGARLAAKETDGRRQQGAALSPIDGIPVALKDNMNVEGLATRNGSMFSHAVPGDAVVTERLRAAGAVILGKLNMDECAIGGTTNNPHFGPTYNPWRPGFNPGGSSGGSASAVAAGLAWAALGSDTLGSVRLPAAYCGVVGLKATFGLIDMAGVVPLSQTLDHVGPICRCVRDARLMLGILAGPLPDAPALRDLSSLRIGVCEQIPAPDCAADVVKGFENALGDMSRLGAEIVHLSIKDLEPRRLRRDAFLMIEAEGAIAHATSLREEPDAFSENFRGMMDYGRNLPAERRDAVHRHLAAMKKAINALFDDVDLLVMPTAPQTAFSFNDPAPTNQAEYTGLANVTGGPAISLPCGLDPSGLPLAIQIMAAPFQEAGLLSAADVLENTWGRFTPELNDQQ